MILPVPAFNVINGGSHAGNKLAMQEFMLLPTGLFKPEARVKHSFVEVLRGSRGDWPRREEDGKAMEA